MATSQQRFLALDVFRGMTVCFMIIVNTPGCWSYVYAPLEHAAWNGFTPTDLVFPSFMFAVGNALSFVMRKWQTMQTAQVAQKILKRSLLIFLIGYLMYWFPFFHFDSDLQKWAFSSISNTRIFGVLQRIAIAYCIAAFMVYFLKERTILIGSVIILLGYWGILMLFGNSGAQLTMQGNAVLKLDNWLIGPAHMYKGEGMAFDPEGLLSTLPSIVNITAGYLVGNYVQKYGKTYQGLSNILLAGLAIFSIAYFGNYIFPINKKIWTSSFVLLTTGLDFMFLASIIYIIDFANRTRWTGFFVAFGKNPLIIYVFSQLLATILFTIIIPPDSTLYGWIYEHIFMRATPYLGSFLFAIVFMLICWVIAWWMDKRKIYVKV